MRDFLCFGGEDRAEEVPCGSRVGFADIRRGAGANKKTRLRAVSRKPRVSLCGELLVKNEYGQEFANACDYRGYSADVRAYGKNERVLNVSANERH